MLKLTFHSSILRSMLLLTFCFAALHSVDSHTLDKHTGNLDARAEVDDWCKCDGATSVLLAGESKMFSSPGYPGKNYPTDTSCTAAFSTVEGAKLRLTCADMTLNQFATFSLTDGPNVAKTYSQKDCTTDSISYNFKELDTVVKFNSNLMEGPAFQCKMEAVRADKSCQKQSCSYQKAAAVSDGTPCADVAMDIMAKKGTAADAMIATLICSGVVNPHSTGIGGGFVATYYVAKEKKAYTLMAREVAPLKATKDMYKGSAAASSLGALAVAVPGEVSGYVALYEKFGGGVSWQELWEPSIKLCKEGFPIHFHLANALIKKRSIILREPTLSMFIDPKTKDVYKKGDILRCLKLAETFKILQKDRYSLKNGVLADQLVKDIQAMGGIIQKRDLETYEARWEEPITVALGKGADAYSFYSVPPPASGAVLGFMLNVLDEYKLTEANFHSSTDVTTHQRIVETFKHAYGLRTQIGDQHFVKISDLLTNMTSDSYAAAIRATIKDDSTNENAAFYGADTVSVPDHGTSHQSVLAESGDAASATGTINTYFGSKRVSTSTGIVLNNEMDDFASPGVINYFGLRPSPNNFIEPGKRPVSSMCPSIIVGPDGAVRLAIGAAGGSKITTSVGLISIYNLWGTYSLQDALWKKRLHHQLLPMKVQYEEGYDMAIVNGLKALGHKVAQFPGVGSVAGALAQQDGKIFAVADTRKAGHVAGN